MENVAKGAGDCAAHTGELTVNVYYKGEDVEALLKKVKGVTTFFHQTGGAAMEQLHECQVVYKLTRSKPKVSCMVVCSSP